MEEEYINRKEFTEFRKEHEKIVKLVSNITEYHIKSCDFQTKIAFKHTDFIEFLVNKIKFVIWILQISIYTQSLIVIYLSQNVISKSISQLFSSWSKLTEAWQIFILSIPAGVLIIIAGHFITELLKKEKK